VNADWELVAWLRGSTGHGQGRYVHKDGTRALVTFTRPPAIPVDELTRRLQRTTEGVAPLLAIELTDERAIMYEHEPNGAPLSAPMSPLSPDDALAVLRGIAAILARAAEAGEVLGGIRPELVYVGPELQITGIAPRAELLAGTTVPPLDLLPSSPFDAMYGSPELLGGGPLTPAADLYSACSLFLYVVTRSAPFGSGDGVIAQFLAMQRGAPEIPSSVPASIAAVVRAGLAVDPASRPSAQELLVALPRSSCL
jgi:serine/threonine protein kinase